MQKKFLMIAAVVVLLCLGGLASAAIATWTGDYSTSFMAPLNWDDQTAPTTGDVLTVALGDYYQPVFDGVGTTSFDSIFVSTNGHMTVNSGQITLTGIGADGGSLAVWNKNLATDGLTINSGGTLRTNGQTYIGRGDNGDNFGRATVQAGGYFTCSSLTIGYQASTNVTTSVLYVYGSVNMGNLLRMAPSSSKACNGKIDIRNAGKIWVTATGVTQATLQGLIDTGRIVSAPGYAPIAAAMPTDANFVQVTAEQVAYATSPTPFTSGAHVAGPGTTTLSWINPLPSGTGATVTSNVYFGTVNPPVTQVATGTPATSVSVAIVPQTTYYWRVDSIDSLTGLHTNLNIWTFDTIITPTVTVGTRNNRQAAFRTGTNPADTNSVATLEATATDDGYPSPMTYTWAVATVLDEPNVTFTPNNSVLNPTATFKTPHDYSLTLTVYDGAVNSVKTLIVRVFPMPDATGSVYCDAKVFVDNGSSTWLAGDVNQDCKVNYKDLATLAFQWLLCNSPDCM
jgi:hypothetical protein